MGSNFGQTVLIGVGTVVGSAFGYPQLGYLLGNLAGQALFPTQLPGVKGPRLQDLTVQSAALGAPVPLVFGTYTIAGNIIWSGGITETSTTTEVGGKGGPTQRVTEYSYDASLAVGICEGPIAGIRRIWADTKLIYDAREQSADGAGGIDVDGLSRGEIIAEFFSRMAGNVQWSQYFTVYLGTESQDPDPTIESVQGAGNVPAYRGLAYVVFERFPLEQFGNRIPNFRFEVYTDGVADSYTETQYAADRLYQWSSANDPRNSLNDHRYRVDSQGSTEDGSYYTGPNDLTWTTDLNDILAADSRGALYYPSNYGSYSKSEDAELVAFGYPVVSLADDRVAVWMHFNKVAPTVGFAERVRPGNICDTTATLGISEYGERVFADIHSYGEYSQGFTYSVVVEYLPLGVEVKEEPFNNSVVCVPLWVQNSYSYMVRVERVVQPPLAIENDPDYTALESAPGWYVGPDGTLARAGDWTYTAGSYLWLSKYATDGGTPERVTSYPRDPVRPVGHADDTEAFWTAAYAAAVAAGDMAAGLVYGVDYPVAVGYAYERSVTYGTATPDRVALADVVSALAARAGLSASQVDTSGLSSTVHGYLVGRVMTARDAIEPLRPFGRFDSVERDGALVFVERGGAVERTLSADDLGSHDNGSNRPSVVEVRRQQDVELPKALRVHYASVLRDYEPGEQAAARLTTDAVHLVDLEVPLALSEAEAAEVAEVALFDSWAARNSYRFAVDWSQLDIDPCTVLEIEVDGEAVRVRVVSVDESAIGVRRIEAVRDDDGVYTSYAVGAVGAAAVPAAGIVTPVESVLLDLPPLRDADDDAGFYAVFRGLVPGAWRGAALYRSVDGGASYQLQASATTEAVIGELVDALGAGVTDTWDNGNTITVRLASGEFSSATEAAVIAGGNALAIGAHGRWEVVQFTTATQRADEVWELSGLLRGRRGTEHNVGSAAAGDSVVLLTGGGVVRVGLELARVGQAISYKAAGVGEGIADVTAAEFTGTGEALRPFSVVALEGSRNEAGDLALSWIRRGRIGEELPDGADIPLSEEREDYEVDIVNAGAVVRTISVSGQAATYTAAQQVTDFGALQGAIVVQVYQISAEVGRGTVTEATL